MIFSWVMTSVLICCWLTTGALLTSCSSNDDNPTVAEVTLEDALKDGTIVALTFHLNGEEFYVAFMRVGDTYELGVVQILDGCGATIAHARAQSSDELVDDLLHGSLIRNTSCDAFGNEFFHILLTSLEVAVLAAILHSL